MAIMNAPIEEVSSGIKKTIELASLDLIMQNMQKNQYTRPVKSAVREVVSNSLDSLNERDIARKILTGKARVEDYYQDIEGELYADSRFDPSYYDLNWLDTDRRIEIRYISDQDTELAQIRISDNGVGLGGKRLRKYFNLGYSTKRLSTVGLGKFGIGAKSPLAAAKNKYYIIESRYNGLKYRFNVYNASVESCIPRFNMTTREENVLVDLGEGVQVYAEKTQEKNGVTVSYDVKRLHKDEYIDAVRSQLLYFDDIHLIVQENGISTELPYKADILYEDEYLLISDNKYYSKPHILLNRVNYGYIEFKDLEIEELEGNVGIKVAPEQVDVNPSRETLIWEDNTKETILKRLKEAQTSANNALSAEVQINPDFIQHMKKLYQVFGEKQDNSVLRTFRKLLGSGFKFDLKYPFQDKHLYLNRLPYGPELYKYRKVVVSMGTDEKTHKPKILYKTSAATFFGFDLPVVICNSKLTPRKVKYLFDQYGDFLLIRYPNFMCPDPEKEEEGEEKFDLSKDGEIATSYKALDYWLTSSSSVIVYEDVEVPGDFKYKDATEEKNEEDLAEEELQQQTLSAKERRKLTGDLLMHTLRIEENPAKKEVKTSQGTQYITNWAVWQSVDVPLADIDSWDKEETFYGTDADSDLLKLVALLTRTPNSKHLYYESRPNTVPKGMNFDGMVYFTKQQMTEYNKARTHYKFKENIASYRMNQYTAFHCPWFFSPHSVRLVKVAKDRVKYIKDFKHINKFFLQIIDNRITMSTRLIRWNTARKIKESLHKLNFLGQDLDNPEIQEKVKVYHKLYDYVRLHYNELGTVNTVDSSQFGEAMQSITSHLDKVEFFQRFVAEGNSTEAIASVAKELWSNQEIQDGCAVDLDLIKELEELLEWAEPVSSLLNLIPELTGPLNRWVFNPRVEIPVRTPQLDEKEKSSILWLYRQKGLIS